MQWKLVWKIITCWHILNSAWAGNGFRHHHSNCHYHYQYRTIVVIVIIFTCIIIMYWGFVVILDGTQYLFLLFFSETKGRTRCCSGALVFDPLWWINDYHHHALVTNITHRALEPIPPSIKSLMCYSLMLIAAGYDHNDSRWLTVQLFTTNDRSTITLYKIMHGYTPMTTVH